ncbi:MAG: hypothetical protein ACRYG6_11515 [Janthinobacterium lividum]
MAKPDRQSRGRSGEPLACATDRHARPPRVLSDPGAHRAAEQARARPGWREPFVLILLGLAGLGATILVCAGVAVPMDALMP